MEAGTKAQTKRKEEREGESVNELIFNDPKSAYVAGEIFARNQQNGIEIAEKIIQGIPLDDAENQELMEMRSEIVRIKRDVEGVYDMMEQGRILEELVSVDWYFSEIRKSVGLNNMSSVIKFEDLVQMRLSDEAAFGQLMINCQSYKDSFENFTETGQDRLKKYVKRFGISQYKIEELMEIPLTEEEKLREKIREIIKSKLHLLSIKKIYQPENELMEILKEERRARTNLNVERHDVATSLKDILVNNDAIKDRIDQNMANLNAQIPEKIKKELTYKDSGALFKEVLGLADEHRFPGEEDEKELIKYWEEEYKPTVAKDLLGNDNLSEQEIEDYWKNLRSAEFIDEQNRCFDEYKNNFVGKREERNEGFWFERVVNLIRNFLGGKTIEEVNPTLRSKLSKTKKRPPQQGQRRRRDPQV